MEDMDNNMERRAVVVLAIEHTLLRYGTSNLENIQKIIRKEFNCNLSDCYDHPEYLNKVLRDQFGVSYQDVIKSLSQFLEEFKYQRPIAEFLSKIK